MPSANFARNFLKNSFIKSNLLRFYATKQSPNKLDPSQQTRRLKELNLLGTIGITSVLLTSYLMVRSAHKQKLEINDPFQPVLVEAAPEEIKILSEVPVAASNNEAVNEVEIDISSGYLIKEEVLPVEEGVVEKTQESLRHKYNFIKKVVNECADAVFHLELRDPYVKDLETGGSIITSNGSGFLISEDGWALTNAHVVLNKPQITVTAIMKDGRSFNAKIEDADMNIDLALLKLETKEKLPCLAFGEAGDTSVGEWVVALGSPLSLSNSATVGIVSSADRPAEELGLKSNYAMRYIQTDASITFGNSGGPLVNLDGNVIGINNLRLTSGISFAIPVEYIRKFLKNTKYRMENLSNSIKLNKTLFGLTTISINRELLADLKKEKIAEIPNDITQGLLVWKIIEGTPADKSGLEVGDVITHINEMPVEKPIDLYNSLSNGNSLNVNVIKKGKRRKVLLQLD